MGSEEEVKPKFVADCMLGTLAKWLRLLGYDVAYSRDADDDDLVRRAVREDRILLTRDNILAKRRLLRGRCVFVEGERSAEQLKEVLRKLSLQVEPGDIFTRCIMCNGEIETVDKLSVKDMVPPYVYQTQKTFGRCRSCGKIYWRGTHVDHVTTALKDFHHESAKGNGERHGK